MSISLVCLHRHVFIAKWFNTKFGIHKCVCQKSGNIVCSNILYVHDCIIVTNDHKKTITTNKIINLCRIWNDKNAGNWNIILVFTLKESDSFVSWNLINLDV